MRIATYILVFFILLLGLTFACLNAEDVSINYYVGSSELPLSILLAFSFVLGGITGLLVVLKVFFKMKCEQRRLAQRIKLAEKEIENLRVIPLKDH